MNMNAIDLRKEMDAKIKVIKDEYRLLIMEAQDGCEHEFEFNYVVNTFDGGPKLKAFQCKKCGKKTTKGH